jgi:signal transduction histidine kinase
MKRPLPRYFLASVALLLALVALHTGWSARRTQRELLAQMEDRGLALAEALEATSRAAIRANALMEEMIAQRLLDNARLIDRLLSSSRFDPAALPRVAATNSLRRVDLLDRNGAPYPVAALRPPTGPGTMAGMMRGMMGSPIPHRDGEAGHPPMRMFMWGRRWGAQDEAAPSVPPAIEDRKFWEGSLFGVAVGARAFPGIIAVHADARFVLDFTREVGVEAQLAELGRRSGIVSVALLDRTLRVLADSDASRVGRQEDDPDARAVLDSGRGVSRLVTIPSGPRVFEVLRPLSLGGPPALLRIQLSTEPMARAWRRDRDGGILLGVAVLALGATGLALIFYSQHRHLSEVRGLEEAMARRERLATLGDLAAAVGHEVRNPLNAISIGLERIAEEFKPAEDEEYRRLVSLMRGEVARLNGIIEEFLSLARPLTLSPAPTDAAELLRAAASLLEAEAARARVEIRVDVPAGGLPPVRADRERLAQVVLNVALNALQAMPLGGTLTLSAHPVTGAVALTVTDTGTGIPPDVLPRVFEPYVTTKAQGLGLGLAIARRIVEAHGGRIEAESAHGQGSRFTVTLPIEGPRGG